jgi:RNA polymerase sigma-70 factor (ECF subfamily)
MDPEAFAAIYRTHHPTVLKYLRHRTRDPWLAEDIASEAFVRAWKVIDRFESRDGGMAAWLQRIARNILYDHAKAGYGRHECLSPYAAGEHDPTFDVADPDVGPAELVVRMEDHAAAARMLGDLRLAILRLPTDDQREAMLYRHVDGLSVKEIAEAMHRQEGAIKSLWFRAMPHVVQELTGAVS